MKTLVVAPHPDDELLGCGGTLLKKSAEGGTVGWLLITSLAADAGWSQNKIASRDHEIDQVSCGLGILPENLYKLGFPPAQLDQISLTRIISGISKVFQNFQPQEVFLPHPGDIHTDHKITFEAAASCTKWFRYPSIQTVLTYETLSETNFQLSSQNSSFNPNLFVDITDYIQPKLDLLSIYSSEIGAHPFPRSLDSIKSLALLRGSQRGTQFAEAFQILRQFK